VKDVKLNMVYVNVVVNIKMEYVHQDVVVVRDIVEQPMSFVPSLMDVKKDILSVLKLILRVLVLK